MTEESVEIENLALLLISRLAIVSTGWKISNSAIPIISNMQICSLKISSHTTCAMNHIPALPDPTIRAVLDSFGFNDVIGDIF